MADPKAIKRSFERQAKAVGLRPSLGQRTVVSKTRLIDGLKCAIEEGPWKLTADLAKEGGGEDQGPTPGVLGRGAFGACLAIGYKLWASKLDVPVSNRHSPYFDNFARALDIRREVQIEAAKS